ncbi:MAG: hypothetical protein R3D84_03630 [Paracoccaceae bacterium]
MRLATSCRFCAMSTCPTTCGRKRAASTSAPMSRTARRTGSTRPTLMPDDFTFQLYPDDLDRIEDIVADAMELVPLAGTAGISRIINGPIPYAPDATPLICPRSACRTFRSLCLHVRHRPGRRAGKGAGAEWITEGCTEWDMWSCDPRRYTDYTDRDYCIEKGKEVYGNERAMYISGAAGPQHRTARFPRSMTRSRNSADRWWPITALGTCQLVRSRRRYLRREDGHLGPVGPVGAKDQGRMRRCATMSAS